MNFFDFITGRADANDVSAVFTSNKGAITAKDAYKKSRFGIVKTDRQLLEEFFTNVWNLIDQKNLEHQYCGMVEVNADIIDFLPKITERLRNELGFKVIVLDDNSTITNSVKATTDTLKCNSTFILLIWNKEAVEEMTKLNGSSTEDLPIDTPIVTSGNESTDKKPLNS